MKWVWLVVFLFWLIALSYDCSTGAGAGWITWDAVMVVLALWLFLEAAER